MADRSSRPRGTVMALLSATAVAAIMLAGGASPAIASPTVMSPTHMSPTALPDVGHVFVINLENKGYASTFGPGSSAPYFSGQLRNEGALLTQYFGTAHASLPNYIGQISGQGPNLATQSDCPIFADFFNIGTVPPEQAVGMGCVYPPSVRTLPDQLAAKGLSWHGYLEDMGNSATEPAACRHPGLNTIDNTQKARVGDQYAARHNPFVYFHSIIDSPSCQTNNVALDRLPADLSAVATTPNYSMITPNLCHDGHDSPCVDGEPGGLVSADAFLQKWVPLIQASPAFQKDGMLVVTFDESDSPVADASACCGEGPGPNALLPGIFGPGGGRVGAVVVSKFVKPGTTTDTPYNHYSLLASIEDLFALPYLGYAANVPHRLGRDVYTGS
ncbi:MAG: alkaline phosphatase family protein [Mycobacteriaceae bacterium]